MKIRCLLPALMLTVLMVGLSACQITKPPRPQVTAADIEATNAAAIAGNEAVAERAAARWRAIMSDDFDTAYAFLTAGHRQVVSEQEHRDLYSRAKIRWTSVSVTDVTCARVRVCEVTLSLAFTYESPTIGVGTIPSVSQQIESWLYQEDQWYHLPRERQK